MKVLFAVSNEKVSENIIKRYQKEYKEILSFKNVYYFDAILKEIQKDKSYDRIVISEDLEPFSNNNYDAIDKFIFDKLDNISDEAQDIDGNDTAIILICSDRRTKGTSFLVKIFGIGIYNALLGTERSMDQVCRLINKPRVKKEAKMYYKIDSDEVNYSKESDKEVSELEIQNINTHFKKLGKNTDKYAESFANIAAQYTDEQLRIIVNCLPINVKAVLEEDSPKYQELMAAGGTIQKINRDSLKAKDAQKNTGIKIDIIESKMNENKMSGPIVIPASVRTSKNKTPQAVRPMGNKIEVPDVTSNPQKKSKTIVKKREPVENIQQEKNVVKEVPRKNIEQSATKESVKSGIENTKIVKKKVVMPDGSIVIKKVRVKVPAQKVEKEQPIVKEEKKVEESRRVEQPKNEEKPKKVRPSIPPVIENKEKIQKQKLEEDDDEFILPMVDEFEELEKSNSNLDDEFDDDMLPGLDAFEDDEDVLPGIGDNEDFDEQELPGLNDDEEFEEESLPGIEDDEEFEEGLPGLEDDEEFEEGLPGLEDDEEFEEESLPRIENDEEFEEESLPRIENDEEFEEESLPGIEDDEEFEEEGLPGLEDDEEFEEETLPEMEETEEFEEEGLPNLDDEFEDSDYTDEVTLPDLDDLDDLDSTPQGIPGVDDEFEDDLLVTDFEEDDGETISNTQTTSTRAPEIESIKPKVDYSMSNLNSLLTKDKKIVTFLGTTKNGTSFLVNNLAALFSSIGINTAILDMTKNRNSYYIYTNNEEELRNIAYNSISKLLNGFNEGIKVNKNLTVFTALPNDGKDYSDAETILSTLVQNYSLILIDCDFDTPPAYFASCQEIYLVQSMDILTIQPLTAFLRDLKNIGVLEPEKVRVVINKEIKVKSLSEKAIIGGMSFYNDPSMSYMNELFNKDMVKACTIPFDNAVYAKYLDSIATCSISINGYSNAFNNKLRTLGNMVYPLVSKTTYGGGSQKATQQTSRFAKKGFSNDINNTLNQMRKKY